MKKEMINEMKKQMRWGWKFVRRENENEEGREMGWSEKWMKQGWNFLMDDEMRKWMRWQWTHNPSYP